MDKIDFQKFKEIMALLAEIFDKKVSQGLIMTYWQILKSVPLEEFERRAKCIITTKTIKVFPLPAEFLPTDDQAILACRQVMTAMEVVGAYDGPKFRDQVVPHLIEHLGGWVAVCDAVREMNAEKRKWWEREFVKLYQAYKSRDLSKVPPPQLEGIHDRKNTNAGYLERAREPQRLSESIKQLTEGGAMEN